MRAAGGRNRVRRGAGLLAALLMGGAGLVAQGTLDLVKTITHYANPPGLAAGTPEGSYALSGAENLDYFSGHLSYALPLLKIGGRGEAGYTVTLQIPSRWEASSQVHCNPTENFGEVCTPTRYHAMFGDPNAAAVGYGPGIVMRRSTGTYGPCRDNASNPDQWAYAMKSSRTSFVFVDSNGSQHELFDTSSHGGQLFFPDLEACAKDSVLPNRGKIFASRDGGAMTFVADGNVVDQAYLGTGAGLGGVTGGRLFFPNGTMYRVNADGRVSYMRDRFGNVTSFEYAGNPLVLTKVTDATGREVTFTYSATLDTITFPKYGGGVNTIQIGRDVLENRLRSDFAGGGTGTYHELFNAVNDWCAENQRPRPECLVNPRLPVYVLLPNGRQYAFRYNRHAELAEVTLPTGGRFEYDWAGGEAGTQPDGYLASSTDLALIHRVVKQRRAYTQSAGGTAARVTYFEPGTLVTGASRDVAEAQNAASAPRLESHFYNGSPVTGSFLQPGHEPYWNDGKETRTEIRGNGSLLRTAENEWVQLSNQTPVLKSVTTKLNRASGGALWSKIEHSYDLFANIIETTETDWGAGIVGAVLRKRSTAYVTDPAYTQANETNPANYKAHLRRLPLSETVYKVNGGSQTQEARTEFVYDEPAYPEQECAGLALHDTSLPGAPFDSTQYLIDNPARRNTSFVQFGNVTTVNAWVSGSSYISTHAKYDLAGNAVWSQDGRENETALVYGQGNCSLLSAVSTTVGTQTHTVSMQYDFNTGKMTQHTDPAGVATALVYEAALGRLSQVTNGHGTSFAKTSTIAYNDNANTVTVTAPVAAAPEVSSAINAVTTTSYDGLGRVAETERATGGNPVIVKTAYDALGRVASTSLPSDDGNYRYVTFAYDALGRVTSKSWGDGASEQTEYQVSEIGLAADQTKVMDAANKWRVLATDALGRLIRVREPAGSGSTAVETGYTYNALDNLLSVDEGGRMRSFSYDALGRLLSASNPESGTVNYVYDNNGNLTQKTDARGVVTSYTYDELNRPLAKSYSGGVSTPSAAWVWDTAKVGKLTSVASGISKTSFSYDAAGRIAGSVQRTDNVDYAFEYHYYRGWGLRQVKYPSGRWVRYTPDAAERVAQVEAVDSGGNVLKNYWSGALYAPQGALKQVTLGNALTERWSYNLTRQQPYQVRLGTAGNEGSRLTLQFAYCANQYSGASCAANNGNILAQWNYANNHIEHYSYDAVNRLTGAVDYAATQGWSQTYGFDRYGNRWLAVHSELPVDPRTPTSQSFINASNNRLTGANYAFDAAGNQTKHGGWTLAYDAENRLVSSQPSVGNVTTYAYDGEGRRVKKETQGSGATWFVYNASGELAAEYLASAPSGAAATHYVTTDHLGSTRLVTDASGNVVSRHDYLPFGEEIPANYGGRTAGMGYVANAGLTQRFTGKERDTETGLDYFGARYLSGAQGRFTSADEPFSDQFAEDPQSWNLYTYVRNNPLKMVDPDGESATLVGAIGGGIFGAGVAAWRGESIWKGAVSGALAGAVAGSVIDTGGTSLGVIALSGGLGGATGGIVSRGLNGEGSTVQQVTVDAAVGATVGVVLGAGSRAVGSALSKSGAAASEPAGLLPAARVRGNPTAAEAPAKIVVDSKGNAIPLKPGETVTGSPDGRFVQVRDAQGNPTGMRIDGPHKPSTHPDPRAQQPHAHVPGQTNPDGTPWLPVNR